MVGSFGCIIYYCANAKESVAVRLLNSRPSVAVGNWSYSIYLWHAPTHYGVMTLFAGIGYSISDLSLSSARWLVLATSLTVVAISAVNYQYFELPMRLLILNLIRQMASKKGLPPANNVLVHFVDLALIAALLASGRREAAA